MPQKYLHLSLLLVSIFAILSSQALGQQKIVTFVARECPNYTDVMANKARNNIMQSLRNLGIDSIYSQTQAVSNLEEESVTTQLNNCIPLNNWKFTIGNGINSSKDTGSFGSLSKVRSVLRTTEATRNDTDILTANGSPSGDTIDGAINVTLNSTELDALAQGKLTVQGGQPDSPLLGSQVLGFATLRCGLDNYNADNVEFIRFPSNQSRVYCYAYYVNPAPSAGKIVIRKVVEGSPPSSSNPDFVFGGNVSFDSGDTFKLKARASEEFDRAAVSSGNPLWIVSEDTSQLTQGYTFESIICSTEGTGGSTATISGSQVSIALGPSDRVTCTFTNRYTSTNTSTNSNADRSDDRDTGNSSHCDACATTHNNTHCNTITAVHNSTNFSAKDLSNIGMYFTRGYRSVYWTFWLLQPGVS
jgi:hypothetical protein